MSDASRRLPESRPTARARSTAGTLGSRARKLLEKLRRRASTRRSAFNIHLAAFVSVNAFLAFLDFVTGGSSVWFLYPLGAWAIPLLQHYIHYRRRTRLQHRLESGPDLPNRLFRPVRRLHRSMTHYMMGAGLAASTAAYLALINGLTGGGPWWLIPAASMALPVVFHTLILRARRAHLLRVIEDGGEPVDELDDATGQLVDQSGDRRSGAQEPATGPEDGEHPALVEARHIVDEITRLVDFSGPKQAELAANVQGMLEEIGRLCELQREFEAAGNLISAAELERDRALIKKRHADETTPSLRSQYEATLKQLERQIASYRELKHRKELLDLRIRTAVNSLRQINVDLVRLKGDAALKNADDLLQAKTQELSTYLADLQQSYDELTDELGV